MTQEEKELLLKDLSARLPYGVMVKQNDGLSQRTEKVISIYTDSIGTSVHLNTLRHIGFPLEEVKPYLRPMSSMTEEEREDWYRQSKVDYDCEFQPEPTLSLENCHLSVDWLNKNMFDYRGLIPMGLAIEASDGMYKTE